ncbi:hypothetical protein [Alloactinosynnema sp. L-07]|uniref:DUF4386 domain-containing protein n=1 Tax=Alloactinosynnema sp. L-07 TaxID=1653480 RepID=UPI00065EF930|nr:DUF4386 domain-containing protein [Alloactinosynnema sp. L-07]CRK55861.1 hypothetical protein [Alloactinosynnema sp. L-07]
MLTQTRRAAVTGGIGLLLMALLAFVANFVVVEKLVTRGDTAKTAGDILASEGLFRLGVAAFVVIVVLDVIVAWALWIFYGPTSVSTFAAWFRIVYSGVFLVGIIHLFGALRLAGSDPGLMMSEVDTFFDIWNLGLVLFGAHLLLLAYLTFKSSYVPTWVGALLAIAGAGYVVDSIGKVIFAGYQLDIGTVAGFGEVALLVWLLIQGRRVTIPEDRVQTV